MAETGKPLDDCIERADEFEAELKRLEADVRVRSKDLMGLPKIY